MRNSTRENGFTLFDLLITLAIAAIITTIGIPSFRTVLENQRMTSATNELVMSLNLTKSEAIKRVKYVSICKSADGATCGGVGSEWNDGWIVFVNATSANLGFVDVGDEVIRVFPALSTQTTLTASGTVQNFLSIRPSGTIGSAVANMTGTLTLCDERGADSARGVVVQASGQWRVSYDQAHDATLLTCP